MPRRVQMTRRPGGWRHEHPDAGIVARPSKWGNPIQVRPRHNRWEVVTLNQDVVTAADTRSEATGIAVEVFEAAIHPAAPRDSLPDYPLWADIKRELAGKDLACWCPLDQPCHADLLLDIANGDA